MDVPSRRCLKVKAPALQAALHQGGRSSVTVKAAHSSEDLLDRLFVDLAEHGQRYPCSSLRGRWRAYRGSADLRLGGELIRVWLRYLYAIPKCRGVTLKLLGEGSGPVQQFVMRELLNRHVGKWISNKVPFEKEEVGTPTLARTTSAANAMDILSG